MRSGRVKNACLVGVFRRSLRCLLCLRRVVAAPQASWWRNLKDELSGSSFGSVVAIRSYDHFIGTAWVVSPACSRRIAPLAASFRSGIVGLGHCVPAFFCSSPCTCSRCRCVPASRPSGPLRLGLALALLARWFFAGGSSQRVNPGHCCPDDFTN